VVLSWHEGAGLAERPRAGTGTSKTSPLGSRAPFDCLRRDRSDGEQHQPVGTTATTGDFYYGARHTTLQKRAVPAENKTYTKLALGQKGTQKIS